MKKIIITALIAGAISSQAALINWSGALTSGTASYQVDSVTLEANWYVGLYQLDTLAIDTGNLTSDLIYNTTIGINDQPPTVPPAHYVRIDPLSNLNVTDNVNVFTVIFDNADINLAENYFIVDDAVWNVGNDANPVSYNPIGTMSGSWQAVPEPATIGLFGLGALGAWFIRRSKKAQEEEV